MSSAASPPSGGFSLFPNTSSNPANLARNHSRSARPLRRAATPQSHSTAMQDLSSPVAEITPPPAARQAPVRRNGSVREGKRREAPVNTGRSQSAMDGRISAMNHREDPIPAPHTVEVQAPVAAADVPNRCDTAFSEAQTLVRNNSGRSRSSIAKPPIAYYAPEGPGPSSDEPALRSIFPTYNPNLPPDRQEYYPTQASPTHIPRSAISRPLYSPTYDEPRSPPMQNAVRSPPVKSPMSAGSSRWPLRTNNEAPTTPTVSTTEQLRNLWKVANGWKAPASEGRVYVMKMTPEKDTPIYTLSSTTQTLYHIQLNPTSVSAHVSVSRYDPNKTAKGFIAPPPSITSKDVTLPRASSVSTGKAAEAAKNWQEVLTTTLEEESRKQPPNDGLVALLYPTAAARMALDRPNDHAIVQRAEHECARLVWDVDSSSHYLVHPALALPFCITVERNPAWSRTEYTLEHVESPQHLGRLTRDGTGAGWLEVDTSIAAHIDAVYLVDVAIVALMLVAHEDNKFAQIETFEPPPIVGDPSGSLASKRGSRMSRAASRLSMASKRDGNRAKEAKKPAKRSRMEQFEIDIESQTSEYGKKLEVKDKDSLPGPAKVLIKLLTVTFKCFIWIITLGFKALTAMIAGLARCLVSDKL